VSSSLTVGFHQFMDFALPTLIETDDADFEWMIGGVHVSKRGLMLPPGGIDANDVLSHIRASAQSLHKQQGHTDNWMIVVDHEVVGLCGYKYPPSADGEVDIGYNVAASRRRRGHATGAVTAILAKSRADLRVTRIVAETAVDNHASQRVLVKNGFHNIGSTIDPTDGEILLRWSTSVID
jgi:predicted acetyltransferase